jgi:hypothetical protein
MTDTAKNNSKIFILILGWELFLMLETFNKVFPMIIHLKIKHFIWKVELFKVI